jgi:murein DD-endopeptidase MepM/ murein hydrolase activator NlpD
MCPLPGPPGRGKIGQVRSTILSLLLAAHSASAKVTLRAAPEKVSPGQVTMVRVDPAGDSIDGLSIRAADRNFPSWPCSKAGGSLCSLVSLPMEAKDSFSILVTWREGAKPQAAALALPVVDKKYKRMHLKVDSEKVSPSPEQEQRIARERAEFREIYECSSKEPLWEGRFELPTKGSITSPFGSSRVFNGEVKTVHYGVDLRANEKTPLYSTNAGKVVFAKEAFFGGNMVVIDHGMGLFSSYSHMSKIGVASGQRIGKGEKLGMAGSTGRVTGPHLHWAMKVSGLSVDPHQLLRVFNSSLGKKGSRAASGNPLAKRGEPKTKPKNENLKAKT